MLITVAELDSFVLSPLSIPGHDWRTFLAATAVLVFRARRGGELWADDNDKLLCWKNFVTHPSTDPKGPGFTLTIYTKTLTIPLFYPAIPGSDFCPLKLMLSLKSHSPYRSLPADPIFVIDSRPMRRDFMIKHTKAALLKAGISLAGKLGSKSWRAGLVTAAIRAGLPPDAIQRLGAWKSSAYQHYSELDENDLRKDIAAISGRTSSSPLPRPKALQAVVLR